MNCMARMRRNNLPKTTEDFYHQFKDAIERARKQLKNAHEYHASFPVMSRRFREVKGKCESCGLKIKDDLHHFHTHHRNGDKSDNRPENLQCLCILCHYGVDAHHKRKFEKDVRSVEQLKTFLFQRKEDLLKIGNKYLKDRFISEILRSL